jgi:hypothetical protein
MRRKGVAHGQGHPHACTDDGKGDEGTRKPAATVGVG